ncbi:transposase [Kibdelosporangium banguiense]|uniref:Transposase n=1 Tax=Kibdelosporangium banguiense TaxID=1365924 RepID=A0ABS4TCT3_9PSEU|nr:IS1634 family transposase [Kibdelosporangium banguiense]MBP2320088.1 transposase [Kibdelosporangium banguiense]MBP2322144.1 transposase [Kibdelosporangium banguiense]MBP2324180.1 transposase [Kibdelosporangium banguiense]
MYPKVKRVRRGDRVYEYLELVEGHRVDGQVRQRVVAKLGRLDELTATGRLEQLVAGLARLDSPPVGTRREVGPLLLVTHYLNRLGLTEIVDDTAPMRGRASATHGEIIAALVANRLCGPAPLYDVAGWATSAAVAELIGVPALLLNDDRLGRALEALAPVAEQVRCQLLLRAIETFAVADASRLHLDLTAVRFAGRHTDSALVAKGWAADRSFGRQVKTLQATTTTGVSLYFRPHKGSANELPAFTAALDALRACLPAGLVAVADSGLGYLTTLCALDTAATRFVVPLRADTGWAQRFRADAGTLDALAELDYRSQREQHLPPDRRTVYKGLLRPFTVTDRQTGQHRLRVAYIHSSEEAASVTEARERTLTHAETALTRIRNGLGGRYYKTKTQVDTRVAKIIGPHIADLITVTTGPARHGKPSIHWQRNHDAITAAAQLDGLYALATNLPDPPNRELTALDVLTVYKDQWIVEQRHRDLKQTLKVRPIFLHNDDRIEALIAIIGIALLIYGLIEAELRHALGPDTPLPGLLPEHRAAIPTSRAVLTAFHGLHLTYTPTGPHLDRLTPPQRAILAHLDIPLPWPEKTN